MPKVLLVEDEDAIAQTLIYALETEGLTTVWARLGQEALKTLASGDIDVMILDVGLPDINGFDLCRDIRKRSELPILFLTARHGEIDKVLGLELGGDDYVTNPSAHAKSWPVSNVYSSVPESTLRKKRMSPNWTSTWIMELRRFMEWR